LQSFTEIESRYDILPFTHKFLWARNLGYDNGGVIDVLNNNGNHLKYISLDLSGSTMNELTGFADLFITSIILPNSLTSIGDEAFRYCNNLTSITIPNGVTSIGKFAFANYASLTSITMPNSITNMEVGIFVESRSIISVNISNSVTNLRDGTFGQNIKLPSITIPKSVTGIEGGTFYQCDNLTSVKFEGTITSANFNSNAFMNMGDLRAKFYATDAVNGTPGTYTTTAPVGASSVWTKK
jgi:hypothetical protein